GLRRLARRAGAGAPQGGLADRRRGLPPRPATNPQPRRDDDGYLREGGAHLHRLRRQGSGADPRQDPPPMKMSPAFSEVPIVVSSRLRISCRPGRKPPSTVSQASLRSTCTSPTSKPTKT